MCEYDKNGMAIIWKVPCGTLPSGAVIYRPRPTPELIDKQNLSNPKNIPYAKYLIWKKRCYGLTENEEFIIQSIEYEVRQMLAEKEKGGV